MTRPIRIITTLALLYGAAACSSKAPSTTGPFTIGGQATGITGPVQLLNSNGDTVTVVANGGFTFPAAMATGTTYEVNVSAAPNNLRCAVTDGSGTVGNANVTTVKVGCSSLRAVGGTVSNLNGSVTVVNNGNDSKVITQNGAYAFPTTLVDGSSYSAAITAQPTGQQCSLSSPSGMVQGANVTSVNVNCVTNSYTLSVAVTGMGTGPIVLTNNGNDTLSIGSNTTGTFTTKILYAQGYSVVVSQQPPFQRCTVSNAVANSVTSNVKINLSCVAHLNFSMGQAAALAIGQPDPTTTTPPQSVSATSIGNGVAGITASPNGTLYIADTGNYRVLGYSAVPTQSGAAASFVLGQGDPNSNAAPTATDSNSFGSPSGVSAGSGTLLVTDQANNRVLVYSGTPTGGTAQATVVIGQADLVSNGSGCSASTLSSPTRAAISTTKLMVADSGNARILIWNTIPTTSGVPADVVLGQPDLNTCNTGQSPAANTFNSPSDVWSDSNRLIVADTFNNRLLLWNHFPTSNNPNADVVIGQADFTSATIGPTQSLLTAPVSLTVASTGQLFVSDQLANRVVIWDSIPTTNNAAAAVVLGQTTFSDPTARAGAIGLSQPAGIRLIGTQLFVADQLHYRVLVFNAS